jgi:hypothetical protein
MGCIRVAILKIKFPLASSTHMLTNYRMLKWGQATSKHSSATPRHLDAAKYCSGSLSLRSSDKDTSEKQTRRAHSGPGSENWLFSQRALAALLRRVSARLHVALVVCMDASWEEEVTQGVAVFLPACDTRCRSAPASLWHKVSQCSCQPVLYP